MTGHTTPTVAVPDLASGNCATADPDAWYPEKGESAKPARSICYHDCPVFLQCAMYALLANERHGIWGGMTPEERASALGRRTNQMRRLELYGDRAA